MPEPMEQKPDSPSKLSEGAVIALFESLMAHLREIKQIEMQWLGIYSLLAVPAAGYVSVNDMSGTRGVFWILAAWVAGYFLLTRWAQDALCKERFSYYHTMLIVARLENYLGFIRHGVLPRNMACAAFPEGIGPNDAIRAEDNTQRRSSFRIRITYTFIIFLAVLAGCVYQIWNVAYSASSPVELGTSFAIVFTVYCLLLLGLDGWLIRQDFSRDKSVLRERAMMALKDKMLGADSILYGDMNPDSHFED